AFYRRRGAIAATLAGRPITIEAAWRLGHASLIRDPYLIELAIDDERGAVVLPLRLVDAILPKAMQFRSEHAAIVLELMLADGLDAVEAALSCRLSIVGMRRLPEPAPRTSFCLTLSAGDLGRVPCELALTSAHATRLAAVLDRLATVPTSTLDLELPACLRLATATLTVRELGTLEPGDVVLAQQACRVD